MRHRALLAASVAFVLLACGGDEVDGSSDTGTDGGEPDSGEVVVPPVRITSIDAPVPILPGTTLRVSADAPVAWSQARLLLETGGVEITLD